MGRYGRVEAQRSGGTETVPSACRFHAMNRGSRAAQWRIGPQNAVSPTGVDVVRERRDDGTLTPCTDGEAFMASVNKVILVGNLGRDPELRYTQSGQPVATFSIATTDRWRDKDGANQERTEWHRIVVWGKSAENCAKYLQKGRSAYIEGRLQTNDWEDKEGNKRTTTEVIAQTVQFLGGGGGSAGEGAGGGGTGGDSGGGMPSGSGSGPTEAPPGDDVPF